jgi:hypothetical protein
MNGKVTPHARNGEVQRLYAFALNTLHDTTMKRVCYEVKVSRGDVLAELKQPLMRRIGTRYSNGFYFVTPASVVTTAEIPLIAGSLRQATRHLKSEATNRS